MTRERSRLTRPPYMSPLNQMAISVIYAECLGRDLNVLSSVSSSAAWTANLCIYVPLLTYQPVIVSHLWWINGATVNGNTDVAIYSFDGATKIVGAGATANSGTNTTQTVNVTDVTLAANSFYWLALGSDSGTQTYFLDAATALMLEFIGVKQQAAGYSGGLPTPISLDAPSVAVLPLFGLVGATTF